MLHKKHIFASIIKNKQMNELILRLENMPFVTRLKQDYYKTGNPHRHLVIDVSIILISKNESSIDELHDLLNSQSFFEWTVNITY